MINNRALDQLIQAVGRRRMQIATLKGLSILCAGGAGLLLLLGWAAYRYRTNTGMLISLRLIGLAAVVAAIYLLIVRPFRRRPTNVQIARLIEERQPGMADRLVSAVEFGE